MGNQYTQEYSKDYKLNLFIKHIQTYCPEWEYVRGFTWSDGRAVLKNKICGHEKNVSCITVRKMGEESRTQKKLICRECIKEKKQKEEQDKYKRISIEQFKKETKPVRNVQTMIKICPQCGTFYFGFKKDKFCSDECKELNRKKNANRYKETKRKMCRTQESRFINLDALYKRDNGLCWLCGKPCDMSLDPNDNYYPSIDHVYPVSLGGKDSWDNVRLAHRICNTKKSNKIDMVAIKMASKHSPRV